MRVEWFERLIIEYLKELSVKERLQLIQKITELSVEELNILEAKKEEKSP